MSRVLASTVMPALGAGIHDFFHDGKVVDGRAKPGHDVFALVGPSKPEHNASACVPTPEAS